MNQQNNKIRKYLDAVQRALASDHINLGFYVKGPEDYFSSSDQSDLENFLESDESNNYRSFIDKVGLYFDAITHYQTEIEGVPVATFKEDIIRDLLAIVDN